MKTYWVHSKTGKAPRSAIAFNSSYERDRNGERIFVLTGKLMNGRTKRITFESWEAAKKLGWIRIVR